MSSFLSDNIKEIFCKYDDNYISPSVKRFLRESLIQLIEVSLLSINNKKSIAKNKFSPNHNFSKQLSLLTEWLENFIEPSHISMYAQTTIHIIRQLEKNVVLSSGSHHHRHHHRHSLSSRTPRQSMSITNTPTDFAMTPVEEQHKKFQKLSLFARLSGNSGNKNNNTDSNRQYLDDEDLKYNMDHKGSVPRSSLTVNSQTSEIRLAINTSPAHQISHSDDISGDLNWSTYEKMSIILIGALTSILNKLLKRYNYKVSVIFDDQFDKIIDDVIKFLFSRLTLQFTDKFRGIIGDCLGVISRKYLQKICERIHARWAAFGDSKKNVKGNGIKKFAILHRAVKYLVFDIYGRNRDAAIDYLTHLCIRMQRTEKRILRQQICHSLLHIFDTISPQKKDEINKAREDEDAYEDKPFIRQCPKDSDEEFWVLYYTIFNIVEQWSHKKTCTIFCYELIVQMMCCGNLPFYLHVLKYEPKSKSGYILPSLHRNKNKNMINSSLELEKQSSNTKRSKISALPDNPSKSPIIKFLISNLTNDNTKRDTLRIILQFVQELPEEFVVADNEWYAQLLHYLEDKIILSSNPNQPNELKIIAAIFTAFAERDGKSYFVPAIQRLLVDNKLWWNRIGLETLHHAVVVFGHSLSKYNFTLGACLSPFVRGANGSDFQLLALQCWPTIRSPRERVEDIHNEVMCMVQLINGKATNQHFARLAADNLINYVEIDFENHLIPVVSSLLSPMRDFKRFNVNHLKITIEVLSKIIIKLISYLERLDELGYIQQYYLSQKNAQFASNNSGAHNLSDSEYDELIEEEFGSINNIIDAVAGNKTTSKNLPIPMHKYTIHEPSVEYDDVNQEFYRVRNALSLREMWPHIRLLIEGYILLWYLHPDQYIRDQLRELLSVVRHPAIINIDPSPPDGPPSIYDQLQRYNSRHHKNDGYSSSGNVNLGTNTSISNTSNSRSAGNATNVTMSGGVPDKTRMNSPLPHRYAVGDEAYEMTHQFPPELDRLIHKKRKSFEGLLNWVFLRTTDQLPMFFDKIMKEEVAMELYDDDDFVLMKHRWELMCLSVRIDESYYQQTNDDKYIASFHRARSSSLEKDKYYTRPQYGYGHSPQNYMHSHSPQYKKTQIHNRYATQSSTTSNPHKRVTTRELSQSQTVVINGAVKQLKNRAERDNSSTIHLKQNTNSSIGMDQTGSLRIVNRIIEDKITQKSSSVEIKHIKVGGDEAVQDLFKNIKFSRAISGSTPPTVSQLAVGKNRLRLIGPPNVKDNEAEPVEDGNKHIDAHTHSQPVARRKKRSKSTKKDQKKYTVMNDNDEADENETERGKVVANGKKRLSLIKTVGLNLVQSLNQNKTKSPESKSRKSDGNRDRLPSQSKESVNPPTPDLDLSGVDVKAHRLRLDTSPNGSPLPTPLIQGDSGEEIDGSDTIHALEDMTDDDDVLGTMKSPDTMHTLEEYEMVAKLTELKEEESKWGGSNEEEEKNDTVGPLLADLDNLQSLHTPKVSTPNNAEEKKEAVKKHPQVHYSEEVHYNTAFGYPLLNQSDEDDDQIYDYHREQISMFLVPMRDIRIPKRKLNTFLDEIIAFTLMYKEPDDEILDSIFEPIGRMDYIVSEVLIERLFLAAFWCDATPQSENDSGYNKWKVEKLQSFYFHAPILHLLSVIYTNKQIMNYDYSTNTFHHPSNEFAIGLDKVIVATVYLVDNKQLQQREKSFENILYLLILMKQFFYFYRSEEPKFKFHPFLDVPGMKNADLQGNDSRNHHNNNRVLLMKKPRPLSNMRMRANLLEFIQIHMSPIPKRIRKLLRKLEENAVNELIENKKHNKNMLYGDHSELTDEVRKKKKYQQLKYLHNSIEIALAECILGLIELGPIGEKTLEMALLKELEKYICHQTNKKLKSIAQWGMNAVFKHNSHLLEHFIQQSCKLHLYYNEFVVGSQNTIQSGASKNRNDKNITLISLAYLTSLVSNFQSNLNHTLNPISALVLCMLHQCSPHQQARNLALTLAKCMAEMADCSRKNGKKKKRKNKYKYNFNPGVNFLFSTTTASPDKYLKFAFDYSGRIASLRPEIVPQVMYEVVRFYDRVESEYDREILLRLLPPWIAQFSTVINKIEDITSCREMSYAFIVKLYELTNQASKSPNYQRSHKQLVLSYALWCNLALSKADKIHFDNGQSLNVKRSILYNEMLISEIVKYIIQRYTSHYVEEHVICENILINICNACYVAGDNHHNTNLYLLAQCLGKSLHRYPDEFPLEPEQFNQYKYAQQRVNNKNKKKKKIKNKDTIKSTEQSAFKLINKLLDNKIINPFKKYIPLLLQNAAVSQTNNYKNTFDDIVLRLAKYFRIDDDDDHHVSDNNNVGIMVWKKYNPEMCKLWSDLAISWALQSNKPDITMYSVQVFDALDSYTLNYDLLVQLSLITYHCIKQTHYPTALFTMILRILQNGLSRKAAKWENDQYKIALTLAYILLSLQHESIHKSALAFWNKFLSLDMNNSPIANVICDMHDILSFNNKNIDQIIAMQLQHSLARESLFEPSLAMLEKLCCLLSTEIPAKSNKLLHLTVLSHMLRIQIGNKPIRNTNCDRLVHVLSHYQRECQEMIKQCKNIQLYKNFNEFLTECCKTYFKLFPSISVFRGGLSALCKFIEYGSKLWYVSVLNIINIIFDVTENNNLLFIDSQQFKQIANILVLASYLSPIKVEFEPNKSINIKSTNKSIINLPSDPALDHEYINLTPLVSVIALKLTKRKQLKLPQDKNFLFQFIDPLPESLTRVCKEEKYNQYQQHKSNGKMINIHKRLVLSHEEEKKCEQDTIIRLKQHLLPLLSNVVRSSQASKHMRSGSILNFNKANLFDLKDIKNSILNESKRQMGKRFDVSIKVPKQRKNTNSSKESSSNIKHDAFNSTASVVIQATPSEYTNSEMATPQPIDITPPISPNLTLTNDILYDVDENDEDYSDYVDDSINQSYAKYTEMEPNNGNQNNNATDDEVHDENEEKQIEYDEEEAVAAVGDAEFIEKSASVFVHKQYSTKDYGSYGYGNVGKENTKNAKVKRKLNGKHKNDTFLIKVEEIPPKVDRNGNKQSSETKHVKNEKSNSNNSVIENETW